MLDKISKTIQDALGFLQNATVVLILLKATHQINWHWIYVFMPSIIGLSFCLIMIAIILIFKLDD